tara:strand:- start:2338 stop:2946 length:609 start_codon:yes stop_codon:yes gene_type:complete
MYKVIFTDRYGKNANHCKAKNMSLDDFLYCVGYQKKDIVEGHTQHLGKKLYDPILNEEMFKNINNCVEIGFNAGHSADKILTLKKNINMISFDTMQHSYSCYGKIYIEEKYDDRHLMFAGTSQKTIPAFHKLHPNYKADLIFIDGDHSEKGAYLDIVNCKKLAHKDTIILIDDIIPHQSYGKYVYKALKKAIFENKIILLDY